MRCRDALTMLLLALVLGTGGLALAGALSAEAAQAPQEPPTPGEEVDEAEGARTFRDWYEMGGWIMHGILGCSVLTFGLVLERLRALRRGAVIPAALLAKLHEQMKRRDLRQVMSLCVGSDSSIARVLRAGLLHVDQGLARMQDAVETAGGFEATLLRRNLPMLAALANIATMMGLLGTVLGMIESFDLIAKTGTGDARVVAGGIFQALVTTAAGLIVGITAVACHSFLRRRVEVLEADLEEISFRMLEDFAVHGPAPETATTGPAPGLTPQEA
ncbi:MAG: MotA/TolQ/ExbB proton channel family protein [Myxococcota bacterium]